MEYARFLRARGWEVLFLSPDGEYTEKIREAGFRHTVFDFSRKGINPFQEMRTIRRIKALYEAEKPDLVHHFTIKCDIYGSLAAESLGIRSVVNSITGLGYMFLSGETHVRLIREVVKILYKKALSGSQVVFENPDDRALFLKLGLVREDNGHVVLGTGVDVKKFFPSVPPAGIPLTILPARMIRDKGILEFVEAAAGIRQSGESARFALVGENDPGNPTSIPSEQLKQWQKEGNVEWWGWKDDIAEVINASHIVCLPSYREGLPKVLIEAASCGRPIVTTDVPGCREVVKDWENGYLVPAKESAALRDALLKLIRDPELRSAMGKASRSKAVSLFSNDIVNKGLWAVYQKALDNK